MYVLGAGTSHDHNMISQMPDLTTTAGVVSGAPTVRMAGIKPDEVDLPMGYAFTITALLHLEDLGFCEKGEGGAFVESGATAPGGSLPMNTNGGGLSYTHPGMYGMFLITEAVKQLRGEAGERQVDGVEIASRTGRAACCRACPPRCSARGRRCDRRRDRRGPRRDCGGMERKRILEPPVTETTQPFWDAPRDRRLLLQWCAQCDHVVWFPARCVPAVSERPSNGGRRPGAARSTRAPSKPARPCRRRFGDDSYVVAIVELHEGARLMTNVVGCPPDSVTVGMPVQVTWEALSDGRNLPLFEPAV